MSRKENNTQSQKRKISKLAIASVSLGIVGFFILFFTAIIYQPRWIKVLYHNIDAPTAIAGLIFGLVALMRIKTSRGMLKGNALAILGIVLTGLICGLWSLGHRRRVSILGRGMICSGNLYRLKNAMQIYARQTGQYPEPSQWCDLLLEQGNVSVVDLVCPSIMFYWPSSVRRWRIFTWPYPKKGRCHYAMNPNCNPNSPRYTVLLFESREGWNQFGGTELVTTKRHGRICNILVNGGGVIPEKWTTLGDLRWGVEDGSNSGNFRRPHNEDELKYWLENMVWYHQFTNEEISAATGMTEKEIVAALKKLDIRRGNRPKRAEDGSLLVLPYPGGRHPRIGFLDGAIEPQRETKFSVFTPWDANSYVVVDLPEAIWSNLGLTYLAHTHIDTIWTKQGIELPKLEWNRKPDGILDIERKLPNGIVFGVKVKPTKEAVRVELWIENGTDKELSDLRVQNCVMTKMAVGFEQQTNDNKVLTNPYVACRSSDGRRWIITAWENCNNPWANQRCPCFHSDPKFPDLEPGQTYRLHGWLSFYEGTDIKAEFKRIEATGWLEK